MKKLSKIKLPKWILMIYSVIVIIIEYVLYTHDRIVMSWTARTMVNLKLWSEIPEYKQYALGRVVIIWGLYGLYKLIF